MFVCLQAVWEVWEVWENSYSDDGPVLVSMQVVHNFTQRNLYLGMGTPASTGKWEKTCTC